MKQMAVFHYLSDRAALGFSPNDCQATVVVPFLHLTETGFQAGVECHSEASPSKVILDQGADLVSLHSAYERAIRMAHQSVNSHDHDETSAQIIPFPQSY